MAFSTNTRQYADAVQQALNIVNDITPSVLALAQALGVTPEKFAKAIHDSDATSLYRVDMTTALQKVFVDSAVAEAKEKKAEAKSK